LASSVTAGFHRQSAHDLDSDGWIDIPSYERWTVRPRLFWEGGSGASAYLTLGAMKEDRVGGTRPGRTTPDGAPFPQIQDTERFDAGLVAEAPLAGVGTAHLRASGMTQRHEHRYGQVVERDRHSTLFAEASLAGGSEATPWVAGLAFQRDTYRSETFSVFNYTFDVPGVFAQVEHKVRDDLTLAASARLDVHNEYGTQFSPRLSLLYRPGAWRVRASLGRGFYAPTPFVEEIEDAGLSRLEPLGQLRAETAQTASVDVGYTRGPVEASVNLFASDIENSTRLETVDLDSARLVNVEGKTRIRGSELLLRYRWNGFTITGSYLYVDATEPDETGGGRRAVPLTPRHAGGLVAMWEDHDKGRLGFEAYYTGRQQLEDNPFRSVSRPYFHLGILGEVVVGPARLFINAENLLNVRQTKYDPLVRPNRAPDGRWTVDVWAPTDGFVINAGVRLRFGGGH
jgi:iron complex outermembrane receptor protein